MGKNEMAKLKTIVLIAVCVILSIITAITSLKVLVNLVQSEDVTASEKQKVVITDNGGSTGDKKGTAITANRDSTIIMRVGSSSIKKLEIAEGYIYFADGWAVFVPKKQLKP